MNSKTKDTPQKSYVLSDEDCKDYSKQLQEPFSADDIEWRVQAAGIKKNNTPWVRVIPYITNRAIQQRLDEVFGFANWKNVFREVAPQPLNDISVFKKSYDSNKTEKIPDHGGWLCGLSVFVGGRWITKWDGSNNTEIEPLKGGLSGAMKRCAVQFGIGRYLYNLDVFWATCILVDSQWDAKDNYVFKKANQNKYHINWGIPTLPDWALPMFEAETLVAKMKENERLDDLKTDFSEAWRYAKAFGRLDLEELFKKEYDAQKNKIEQHIAMNASASFDISKSWLEKQLKELESIPEMESALIVCKTFRSKVKEKAKEQGFDATPLLEMISGKEKSETERRKTLNNNSGEKQ